MRKVQNIKNNYFVVLSSRSKQLRLRHGLYSQMRLSASTDFVFLGMGWTFILSWDSMLIRLLMI